jgi:hypothetical protein|nr:MAG TPA: hypothetical protein [Caudoviricetes sp.]DAM75759.1 MAG TPA: hypothetical protein [Caudoviricetes sp.]
MTCKNCGHGGSSTPSGAVHAAKIQTPETTQVRSWTELPQFNGTNLPDDLDVIGGSNSEYKAWRIPFAYISPAGALNRVQYKVADEDNITIPERQIVPVYSTYNDTKGAVVLERAKAATGETATDIAIDVTKNVVTVMKNGYYTFARPHAYEVGQTYYLSQDKAGEVVSTRPAAGIIQPLFSVIDLNTISINVNLY